MQNTVGRIDALEVFFDLFPFVVQTLDTISEGSAGGWNSESSRQAVNLLSSITKFSFIISFVVTKECLGYVKGLTISLQRRANDICYAYREVTTVVSALTELRGQIDTTHKKWFDKAVGLGQLVKASEPQLPRRCGIQTGRSNVPGDTPEVYYRRIISVPFLDELVSSVLETEIHLWKCKWNSSSHQLPDTPAAALNFASHSMFPNIHQIFSLVCTVPVTSCECERSVSVLRRLKTYLRSNMDQERVSGLALMHIHYNMELNLEEIVDNFARKHPRRIMLTNILEQTGTMPN